MAEIVTIEGEQYKKRSAWGVWGLVWATLGVYAFVWYYKINNEAKHFLRDESIKPGLSVLALFVPIVNWIYIYRTGQRIQRMEDRVGIQRTIEPILGVLASILYSLHMVYYQGHLNSVYDTAQVSALPTSPGAPEIPPAPPPPPPGTP